MADQTNDSQDEPQPSQETLPLCTCVQDPFAGLPPELRPKPKPLGGGLRQVTCPGCGLKYWTNRPSDLCIECEKRGVKQQESVGGA